MGNMGGTAMGTKLAPGFANCFMGDFDKKYVYPYQQQPLKYLRFLDDCFLIGQYRQEALALFSPLPLPRSPLPNLPPHLRW